LPRLDITINQDLVTDVVTLDCHKTGVWTHYAKQTISSKG
jgi:hypothetical protein